MNNTKNFTMRHRLNRDLEFSDDFRRKYMTKEYGNYQKYENNSVETVYDEGVEETTTDRLYENYMHLIRTLPTKEAEEMEETKRDDIRDMLTNQSETHKTFADRYLKYQTQTEQVQPELDQIEEECEFINDPENFERSYYGRLSPFVKEQIYREYTAGSSVKDLSLKYGAMQQRIKAIVYQKHLYWHEVYPRLGETHMRMAFEREALYAATYPFVEYGVDLVAMAEMDKGIKVEHITRSDYDTMPPSTEDGKKQAEQYEQLFTSSKSRSRDNIPIEFQGKAGHGYVLYERIAHKGKDAPRVSQNFKEIVRHYGTDKERQMIKAVHLKRMKKGGVRFASLADKGSS